MATQAWCRAFLAQLVACGVQHVAVSPGSRSTPMTIAATTGPTAMKPATCVDVHDAATGSLNTAAYSTGARLAVKSQ